VRHEDFVSKKAFEEAIDYVVGHIKVLNSELETYS
jgi:hypothetical protein